jgi:CBS-domain-containing membrane protein
VTDRDLAFACVARELDPLAVLAGAIASRPIVCIAASSSTSQAVEAMHSAGIRRLLFCDQAGQVVGLLSSDDLLATMVDPLQMLARSYGAGIERERTRGDGAGYDLAAGPLYLRGEPSHEPG